MNAAVLVERLLRTASNRVLYTGTVAPTRTTLAFWYRRFR